MTLLSLRTMKILRTVCLVLGLFLACGHASYAEEKIVNAEVEEFDFANGLFSRGMYDMAVGGYKDFLKNYPDSQYAELANYRIAECYFMDKKYDEAVNRFGIFLKDYPKGELAQKAMLRKAQVHYIREDYPAAERMLKDLAAGGNDTAVSAKYYLAGIYFKQGDHATAKKMLEEILSEPGSGEYTAFAYINLGDIYTEEKDYARAADYYNRASAAAKDKVAQAKAAFRAANSYYLAGKYDKAKEHYRKVTSEAGNTDTFNSAALGLVSTFYKNGEYQWVIETAEEVLPRVEDDTVKEQILFLLGNSYFFSDKFAESEKVYAEAASAYPDSKFGIKSMLNRCWALYRLGKYEECLAAVKTYTSKTKDSADEALYIKAEALIGAGYTTRAIEAYKVLARDFVDSGYHKEALYEIGWAYAGSGDAGEAIRNYQLFVEEYPDDPRAPSVLLKAAQENLDLGQYNEAETDYMKFLSTFGESPLKENVLFQLGRVYMEKGDYDKAINTYLKFLKEFPESQASDAALYWTGRAYQQKKDWEESLSAYTRLAADRESEFYGKAMESMAYSYFQKGEFDKAAGKYYVLMVDEKDLALPEGVYKWVADYYMNNGNNNKSLEVLKILSVKHPGKVASGEIYYMYAENYGELGDWGKAEEYFNKAIKSGVGSPYRERAYLGLGRSYFASGKYDKAVEMLNEALKAREDNLTGALARFEMGNVKFKVMDFEEAAKQYMMVAILYDDEELCSKALFHAGTAFEKAGMPGKSIEAFRELIERYPESALANEAEKEIRRVESEAR